MASDAISVPCPTCAAAAGTHCIGRIGSGRPRRGPDVAVHPEREARFRGLGDALTPEERDYVEQLRGNYFAGHWITIIDRLAPDPRRKS